MFILVKSERIRRKIQKKLYDTVTKKYHELSVWHYQEEDKVKYQQKQPFMISKHYNTRSMVAKTVQNEFKKQLLGKAPMTKVFSSNLCKLYEQRIKYYLDEGKCNRKQLYLNKKKIINECRNHRVSLDLLRIYSKHMIWMTKVKLQAQQIKDEI